MEDILYNDPVYPVLQYQDIQEYIFDSVLPEDSTVSENVVSDNNIKSEDQEKLTGWEHEFIDSLNGIVERIENVDGNIKAEYRTDSILGNDNNNVFDNQIVSVSENIVNKPINEYSVEESYLFLIFISLFIAGLVYIIRKGIPKWK